MVDFRKWFPALAVVALAFGAASTANAQQTAAFSCVGNAGVPPIVRAEGLSELVGDLVLNCSGGTPTAVGTGNVPQANVQIFLNTNITSRLTDGSWSEALLMIDEPAAGNQRYCSFSTGCTVNGVGSAALGADGRADGVDYDEAGSTVPNVFQGQQVGPNTIAWLGVPIDPPGTNATRIIRITNVRSHANQLGNTSTFIPQQIVMFVSVTGTTSVPINNPQQTVAFIQQGLVFSVANAKSSYLQCVSWNKSAATDASATLADGWGTILRFKEGFASSFKRRNVALGGNDDSPTPVNQNTPGAIYNTESGFYNSAAESALVAGGSTGHGLNKAGLATNGTRLLARFANVPAGVVLYASTYAVQSSSAPAVTAADVNLSGYRARLISTDGAGATDFSAASKSGTPGRSAISLSNGSGVAVWEVLDSDPLAIQTFEFAIAVSYVSNTSNNLPGLATATVAGSFAPQSSVITASSSAPVPRFAALETAVTAFTINPCTTNLLFVFLTNQAGFDSGIAISNTSVDPFGTAPQSGPCKLNYYGETAGGGAAPQAQTSATIPAGKQLTAVLSTGGNYGINATPTFQGYMIAQCQFQYAHGFAFISDVGANRVSEAYLALVLDAGLSSSRTLFSSEVLGH